MNKETMNTNSRKIIFLLPLLLFVAMLVLLFTGLGKDPTMLESQLIGKAIPEFEKELLLSPGTTVTDKDLLGPALLNVFASWCPSCYQEHPFFMRLATKKVVKIYGLNYQDSRQDGLRFINDQGNPYDLIVFDNKSRLGIELGVYGAPETFVIDADNRIIYRHVGVVTEAVWQNKISPMLFPDHSSHDKGTSK